MRVVNSHASWGGGLDSSGVCEWHCESGWCEFECEECFVDSFLSSPHTVLGNCLDFSVGKSGAELRDTLKRLMSPSLQDW
jgi:hypothetical protein